MSGPTHRRSTMSLRRRIAAAFTAAVTAVTGLAILPAPTPASARTPS